MSGRRLSPIPGGSSEPCGYRRGCQYRVKWYYTAPVPPKKSCGGKTSSNRHRTHAVCDYCKDIIITVYKDVEVVKS